MNKNLKVACLVIGVVILITAIMVKHHMNVVAEKHYQKQVQKLDENTFVLRELSMCVFKKMGDDYYQCPKKWTVLDVKALRNEIKHQSAKLKIESDNMHYDGEAEQFLPTSEFQEIHDLMVRWERAEKCDSSDKDCLAYRHLVMGHDSIVNKLSCHLRQIDNDIENAMNATDRRWVHEFIMNKQPPTM